MNYKRTLRAVLSILVVLLLAAAAGSVLAEEELFTDRVELFSEGGFPDGLPVPVSTFGVNSFEEYMIEQLNAQAAEINVRSYQMTEEEFSTAYWALLNAHPELFFVESGFGYSLSSSGVSRVLPSYKYTGSELEQMQSIYQSGVNAVADYARAASTDVGRMLRANDYLCANFEYDADHPVYSPELFFQNGGGVCQAYMLAYRAVLNRLGIANMTVTSDEMNHTWNMVYLDGSWYHIDVTWNDPVSDVPLRAYHTNFLLSDEGITATGHTGWDDSWETVFSASNTKYDDFFWTHLNQAAPMKGDVVYYADSDYTTTQRSIYGYDLTSGKSSKLLTYDYGYGTYYKNYNPIWIEGDMIYYGVRDSLYSVSVNGGASSLVYSTGDSSQWIWYPFRSGSTLRMYAASSPIGSGSIHSCKLNVRYSLSVDQTFVRMDIGETVHLNAELTPSDTESSILNWSSSNESAAVVDASGMVQGVGAGAATITVRYDENTSAECTVIVHAGDVLCLPADTVEIHSEAFAGTASGMIELPEGVMTIGSRAFADNEDLMLVQLPDSIVSISSDAFAGCTNLTLLCSSGSCGEQFALEQGIPHVLLP